MSATKNSPDFDRMMEEGRMADELIYDEFISEQYFRNRLKGVTDCDPGDEQQEGINPPQGTKPK